MQKTTKRKGISVWNLANIGVLFVVLTVSLGIGAWINDELITGAYGTAAQTNETFNNIVNNTYYDMTYKSAGITGVANATITLDTTNYSTRDMGYITQVVFYFGETVATPNFNVSYNAYESDSHFVTTNATASISTLASWLPIIAIVIAAGVVIATLMVWFTRRL